MDYQQQPYTAPAYNPYSPPTAGAELGENPYGGFDTEDHILAGRGTRLGAAMIDGGLALASALPGLLAMAAMMDGSEEDGLILGGVLLFFGLLGLGIYQMYLISTTGQSLGKKWLGIKIIKIDGMPCGFVHGVLLRSWVMSFIAQVPIIGPIASIVDPLLIFGDERRCLHDLIASTKVVIASN